jgi:RNA polymerase sigma factor (sigma-70 family)
VVKEEPDDDPATAHPVQTHGPSAPRLRLVGDDVYSDWDAVYLDNVTRIYRLMFGKVGNRPDAEDLTAEVFLAALGPLRVSASVGEVRSYLLTTARSILAGYWRRRLGVEVTTIDPDADFSVMDEPPGANLAPDRARQVLGGLPERYRQILELRFLQAMSLKEAATEMNVSVGNAKVLQHRALRLAAQTGDLS